MTQSPASDGEDTRTMLRLASVLMISIGAICVIFYISAFNTAFDSASPFMGGPRNEPPFGLGVVGTLMLGGGIALARWAFLRPVASYAAREVAPAVEAIAQSAAAGVKATQQRACLACGAVNDHDARFCDACGKAMPQQGTVS